MIALKTAASPMAVMLLSLFSLSGHLVHALELSRSCQNDDTFEYPSPWPSDQGKSRNCRQIRNKEERREMMYKVLDVYYACPQVCGVCCENNDSYEFKMRNTNEFKNCNFIKSPVSLETYCTRTAGRPLCFWDGRTVRDACPVACNFCFSHIKPSSPSSCENDNTFVYPSLVDLGSPSLNCKAIRAKKEPRDKMCKVKAVHDACPQTCGVCCHNDDAYEFEKMDQYYTPAEKVKCDWLVENDNEKDARLQEYCGKSYNGRFVRDACPEY